jgi:hypothetical protein
MIGMTTRDQRLVRHALAALLLAGCGPGGSSDAAASASVPAATVPASKPAGAAAACGAKNLPDCPTQRWMKATLQTYLRTGDFVRLDSALQKLAAAAPAGYPGWKESAEKAQLAARAHDAAAVKAQCSGCHDQHRKRFKNELRQTPLAL